MTLIACKRQAYQETFLSTFLLFLMRTIYKKLQSFKSTFENCQFFVDLTLEQALKFRAFVLPKQKSLVNTLDN